MKLSCEDLGITLLLAGIIIFAIIGIASNEGAKIDFIGFINSIFPNFSRDEVGGYLAGLAILLIVIGVALSQRGDNALFQRGDKKSSSNYVPSNNNYQYSSCTSEYSKLKQLEENAVSLENFYDKRNQIFEASYQKDHSSAISMINGFISQTDKSYEKGFFLTWIAIFLNLDKKYSQMPPVLERAERLLESAFQVESDYNKKRDIADCLLNAYDCHISLLQSINAHQSTDYKTIFKKHWDIQNSMSNKKYWDKEEKKWVEQPLYSYRRFSQDMVRIQECTSNSNPPHKIYKKGNITLYDD